MEYLIALLLIVVYPQFKIGCKEIIYDLALVVLMPIKWIRLLFEWIYKSIRNELL